MAVVWSGRHAAARGSVLAIVPPRQRLFILLVCASHVAVARLPWPHPLQAVTLSFTDLVAPCPASVVIRNGTTATAPILWSLCGEFVLPLQMPVVTAESGLHVSLPYVVPTLRFAATVSVTVVQPVAAVLASRRVAEPIGCDYASVGSDGSTLTAGTFSSKSNPVVAGTSLPSRAAAIADVNGDGVFDWVGLIVDSNGGELLVWVENTRGVGSSAFSGAANVVAGFAQSIGDAVFAVDGDGDGDVDVIALDNDALVVYENRREYPSAFRFSGAAHTVADGVLAPGSTFVAVDVTNDGLPDCVGGNTATHRVVRVVNSGSLSAT